MPPIENELQPRLKHLVHELKRSGAKLTHQRLEVFREIARADNHPDAETVYRGVRTRLPNISLDTVYRTLALLVDLGLVDKLGTIQDSTRFDGNTVPHHHFVCTRCGEAYDFYSETFDRLSVPDEVRALGRVQKLQVEVRGICRQCSRATTPERPEFTLTEETHEEK